jgi:predicted acylesterase/phospholipase RssA
MNKIIAVTALALAQVRARDGQCHALVMSGGSNNGAWEAGVVWGLVNYGDPADFVWDVITGVSAGSINTCGMVLYPPGEEVAMAQFLSDTWNSITTTDVWLPRPGGKMGEAAALFTEPSILNNSPMLPTLQRIVDPFAATGIQRPFVVASVDANTGDYMTFTHLNTEFKDLAQSCASSASIPGAFTPQHFKGHIMMDGGTMWDINIDSAVNYCLEQGYTEE